MNYNTRTTKTVSKGVTYGELTALKKTEKRFQGMVVWECRCSCGNIHFVGASNLKSGRVKSCGCLVANRTKVNERKFGRLTPIKLVRKDGSERTYWECRCECGNTTIVSTSNLNRGKIKSCGCLRVDLVTGVGSKFYNPDLTAEDRLINNRYVSSEENIRIWRKEIYEKDNYTCQKCFKRGSDLNAHHLDGWNWCREKRFDIDNGVTLCEKCHKDFHKKYGQKDNTKKQFLSFIIQ